MTVGRRALEVQRLVLVDELETVGFVVGKVGPFWCCQMLSDLAPVVDGKGQDLKWVKHAPSAGSCCIFWAPLLAIAGTQMNSGSSGACSVTGWPCSAKGIEFSSHLSICTRSQGMHVLGGH